MFLLTLLAAAAKPLFVDPDILLTPAELETIGHTEARELYRSWHDAEREGDMSEQTVAMHADLEALVKGLRALDTADAGYLEAHALLEFAHTLLDLPCEDTYTNDDCKLFRAVLEKKTGPQMTALQWRAIELLKGAIEDAPNAVWVPRARGTIRTLERKLPERAR